LSRRSAGAAARTRVLDAADALLVRHGFRRMTVDDIAAAAGIGKGSVYLHFRSKEDVALSCLDRMADGVGAKLEALAAGAGPAPERLAAMLRQRVLDRLDYARSHAHSLDALLAAVRPAMLARRARHFEREARVLERVIEDGRRQGSLRAAAPRAAARALVTATNALLPYSLSVRELGRRAEIAARTDAVVGLLLAGLVSTRPAPRGATTRSRSVR